MNKANKRKIDDDLRPEYDLSKLKGGVRGKYAKRLKDLTDIARLVEAHQHLRDMLPDELKKQV